MSENNQMMSVEGQLVGMPLAGPESFSQQQLDYLKRALGVDETVLMNTETLVSNGLQIPLSENFTNFERIRIEGVRNPTSANSASACSEYAVNSTQYKFRFYALLPQGASSTGSTELLIDCVDCDLSANTLIVNKYFRKQISASSVSTATNVPLTITKVVGIHRIAGDN